MDHDWVRVCRLGFRKLPVTLCCRDRPLDRGVAGVLLRCLLRGPPGDVIKGVSSSTSVSMIKCRGVRSRRLAKDLDVFGDGGWVRDRSWGRSSSSLLPSNCTEGADRGMAEGQKQSMSSRKQQQKATRMGGRREHIRVRERRHQTDGSAIFNGEFSCRQTFLSDVLHRIGRE